MIFENSKHNAEIQKTENQNVIDTKLFTGVCDCKMTTKQSIKVLREKALPRILFSTVSGT